ncbi:MAG: hypothetical protein EBR05_10455 [Marivivens sp.]|nr:hypothetical protein [Marivivens sp.]NBX10200.1 hypothetical protein [Marivivens sp.]NDH03917.1 hypothetical protein [Marivivens sp.]
MSYLRSTGMRDMAWKSVDSGPETGKPNTERAKKMRAAVYPLESEENYRTLLGMAGGWGQRALNNMPKKSEAASTRSNARPARAKNTRGGEPV